jgi:hypothetical protein
MAYKNIKIPGLCLIIVLRILCCLSELKYDLMPTIGVYKMRADKEDVKGISRG